MDTNLPGDWGKDHLSEFIERLRKHTFESIAGFKSQYDRLVRIDSIFKILQENSDYSKDWFPALFLLRAHSSFLAAASVAFSGQLPEAYMILRGCLENSVYGFYFSRHEEDAEVWLKRNDSPEMKKRVRDQFKISTLLSFLASVDPPTANVADSLYEFTIDLGAHPNELALLSALRMEEFQSRKTLKIAYISGNRDANEVCLKTTVDVGLCGLSIFRNVFKERYDILGITDQLDALKAGS